MAQKRFDYMASLPNSFMASQLQSFVEPNSFMASQLHGFVASQLRFTNHRIQSIENQIHVDAGCKQREMKQ